MVRKMPRHIVLPNGMWRFIKGKAKSIVKTRSKRVKHKRKSTGGFQMARRRSYSRRGRSRSRGGFGMGGISIKGVLAGALAGMVNQKFAPQMIPYQNVAAGAAVGKFARTGVLSGAIGGLAYDLATVGGSFEKIGGW